MHFLKPWMIPAAFFGVVAAGTAVTAVETHFGEVPWGAMANTLPPHHDTAWYASHPIQRQQVIHWCTLDSRNAVMRATDCENAVAGSNPYWGH